MADWSSLPHEIWGLILEKILQDEELLLEDFFRCGRVCSLWSSIVRHRFSKPQIPWLMLRPNDTSRPWGFLDIATNRIYKSHLPELKESLILASSDGWLIVEPVEISDLLLFNPFSRAKIQLPALDNGNNNLIYQVYLSVSSECGYTVVVDLFTHLYYVRTDDKAWTLINFPVEPFAYRKGTFCKGLFYLLYNDGPIISFDLTQLDRCNNPCPLPLQLPSQLSELSPFRNIVEADYLVVVPDEDQLIIGRLTSDSGQNQIVSDEDEYEDQLIMVQINSDSDEDQEVPDDDRVIMIRRTSDSDEEQIVPDEDQLIKIRRMSNSHKTKTINMKILDPEMTLEMRNLGKYSLFLKNGISNTSYNVTCVTHEQGLIKKNHVYIADDEDRSLNVFDIEVGQCINRIRVKGEVWISPVLVKL